MQPEPFGCSATTKDSHFPGLRPQIRIRPSGRQIRTRLAAGLRHRSPARPKDAVPRVVNHQAMCMIMLEQHQCVPLHRTIIAAQRCIATSGACVMRVQGLGFRVIRESQGCRSVAKKAKLGLQVDSPV